MQHIVAVLVSRLKSIDWSRVKEVFLAILTFLNTIGLGRILEGLELVAKKIKSAVSLARRQTEEYVFQ